MVEKFQRNLSVAIDYKEPAVELKIRVDLPHKRVYALPIGILNTPGAAMFRSIYDYFYCLNGVEIIESALSADESATWVIVDKTLANQRIIDELEVEMERLLLKASKADQKDNETVADGRSKVKAMVSMIVPRLGEESET